MRKFKYFPQYIAAVSLSTDSTREEKSYSPQKFFTAVAAVLLVFLQMFASVNAQNVVELCGGFRVIQQKTFPIGSYDASVIKTYDVNNDGIKDLLVNLPQSSKISVQLGDGEGAFW